MTVLRQVISKLWHGQQLNGDDVIALLLLLAMIASLSHLFTMLVTRWGDRHILVKSLLASVLVHMVCLLGLEVFDPLDPTYNVAAAEVFPPHQVVTQILAESEDTIALRESGNTPIPDKATPPDVELERLPTDARIMEPTDVPDREAEMLDSLQADAPAVSQSEQSTTPEAAIRVDDGEQGKRVVSANDIAAEIETMLEQSKSDVYTPSTERQTTKQGQRLVYLLQRSVHSYEQWVRKGYGDARLMTRPWLQMNAQPIQGALLLLKRVDHHHEHGRS